MENEINIINHPLAHELAEVIRKQRAMEEFRRHIASTPPTPITKRYETEDQVITITRTPKDKRYNRPAHVELLQQREDLLRQIPMMYKLGGEMEFRDIARCFMYHIVFQVEDVIDTKGFSPHALRMVLGQENFPQLEMTGREERHILHLPTDWKTLLYSNRKGQNPHAFRRLRSGLPYPPFLDLDADVDDVGEWVNIYWQPEIPSEPKTKKPADHILDNSLVRKHSLIDQMSPEELQAIPGWSFQTNICLPDSEEIK